MSKHLQFILFFLATLLIFNMLGIGKKAPVFTDDIVLQAETEYTVGEAIDVTVLNNSKELITVNNDCTKTPLITEKYSNGQWEKISTKRINKDNCQDKVQIKPQEKKIFSYAHESYKLFGDHGKYRISLENNGKNFYHEFTIVPNGFFKKIWNAIVYKPIYNLLIWLVDILPGHNLGLAIIILTIIVKLGLLLPNQKALKSQKSLQKIQPELQKIKEKYKGDQVKISQETMAVWKKHKVNPAGSCLPMLLQFPFLIAVFTVLKDGLSENNVYLLFDMLKGFDYSVINSHFLILNLEANGPIYLGLIIGVLQFIQMKLSFAKQNLKNKENKENKELKVPDNMMDMQMQMMNKTFTYVMPVMITLFTLSVPAGVGIYWGISTIFGIVQQQFINKLI